MRDFKFRAWDTEQKKVRGNFELKWIGEFTSNELRNSVNNLILMQFTGLKDKNGKEIYEGDIVDITDGITASSPNWTISRESNVGTGVVTYDDDYSQFICKGNFYRGQFTKFDLWDWEIIGNIYENPELLKEADNGTNVHSI